MVKILCIIFLATSLLSCSNRTEFGRKRPIKIGTHKAPADSSVYTIIDTAAVYERINQFTKDFPEPTYRYAHTFLKFYANGRVGTFHIYDIKDALNDISLLNPKRAEVGYYTYDEKGLETKTLFEHPQGGGFIKERLVKSDRDTLTFAYDNRQYSYHKKIKLPENALIYKPDW